MSGSNSDKDIASLDPLPAANGSEQTYVVRDGQDFRAPPAALLAGRTVPGVFGFSPGVLRGHGATLGQVDDAISALLGGATQEQLNTLNEIGAALGNNPDAYAVLVAQNAAMRADLNAALARIISLEGRPIGSGGTVAEPSGSIAGPATLTLGATATFAIALANLSTGYLAFVLGGVQQGSRVARAGNGNTPFTPTQAGNWTVQLWSAASGGALLDDAALAVQSSVTPTTEYVASDYVAAGYVA